MNELIRIVYWPKDDPQGRRHTSFLRWDCITPPPKDFGKIEKVHVVDPKAHEEFTLVKPSKKDIAIMSKALKSALTTPITPDDGKPRRKDTLRTSCFTGRSRKKGFTLIELMIVVAIIGVLAAIAIPQFARLIAKTNCNKGDKAACAQYKELTKGQVAQEPVVAETPAPKAPDYTSWKLIKGKVKATGSVYGDKSVTTAVIEMGNGTSASVQVNGMLAEETTVCIRYNPNRNGQDVLVLCE